VAVVTGAPNVTEVGSVLHNASEMRADCGKGSQISVGGSNQYSRLAPKLKICPLLAFTSSGLIDKVTVRAVDSSTLGGMMYLVTGYRIEINKAPALVPRNQLRIIRRLTSGPPKNSSPSPLCVDATLSTLIFLLFRHHKP